MKLVGAWLTLWQEGKNPCMQTLTVLGCYCVCMYAAHASCGFLHITGEEVEESKFDIRMQMYAKKLDKKDFFGKVCVCVCVCVPIHTHGQ